MRYVLKLPKGKGYLCHQGTNRVVIYDKLNDYTLALDSSYTKGVPLPLKGEVVNEVYGYGWYENRKAEMEELRESLQDYKGFTNQRDYMEDYV